MFDLSSILVVVSYSLCDVFGLDPNEVDPSITVEGFAIPDPATLADPTAASYAAYLRSAIPPIDLNYQFRKELVRDIRYWWLTGEGDVLLLWGPIYDTRSSIAPEALDGAISYISLLSGASLIFSPSLARTPHILHRMALHATHGLGYEIPLRAGKPKGPAAAQYLLEGLPTVGPKAAQALLAHFGSPRGVFSASREQLLSVKGIGPKSADAILAALS